MVGTAGVQVVKVGMEGLLVALVAMVAMVGVQSPQRRPGSGLAWMGQKGWSRCQRLQE